MEDEESKENCKSLNPCPSLKKVEVEDDAHLKKYITWENKSNICWLDASMALVAHNKVMKRYSGVSPECRISKIISAYDDAICILNSTDKTLNQKINLARGKLNYVQESTLQYLKPILKYKTGDPESAFCSLYNLLIQDSVMKHIFDVAWISAKECTDCGHYSESTKSKPIITLSKIDSFDPGNPQVVYNCVCNRSDQKIKLVYVSLPPCLIFHFENGAGTEKPPLNFITREREYHLTGIMTLEKSQDSTVNHFITWVRNPFVDKWLDCNDLNIDIISYSPDFPDISFRDVYMYVYESFDDLGTITDSKIVNTKKSEENIPCIDLSEESDTENDNTQNTETESKKDIRKVETSESNLKSFNDNNATSIEPEKDESLERAVSTDNNSTVNKNIILADFDQNLKNISDKSGVIKIHENPIKQTEMINNKVSDNIKTDNNDMLRTSLNVTSNVNITSIDRNKGKIMNENSFKSDCRKNNVKIDKTSDEDSNSLPSVKETLKENRVSLVTDGRHGNSDLKSKTSTAKNESLFHNEKKENFSMSSPKNIENKEILFKKFCSNTLDKPKRSGRVSIRDLIQTRQGVEYDAKKEDNNSDQCSRKLIVGQNNNERPRLNSNAERQIHSEHFLSHTAANSSGTSYVKVSVRRKKYSHHPLYKNNCMDDTNNPDSDERFHNTIIEPPSITKSLKRNRVMKQDMDEDCDKVPIEMPKKKQQLKKTSNVKKDAVIKKEKEVSKAKVKVLKTGQKKKSQMKSKLYHTESIKTMYDNNNFSLNPCKQENPEDHNLQLFQDCTLSGAVSKVQNSNAASGGEILQDFRDVWSCHKPGCNCDFASLEETVDVVVDYTFGYLCKLSQEFKMSKSE